MGYYNVVNFSAVYSPQAGGVIEAVVAMIPKHLPLMEITVIASNPAGDTNLTNSFGETLYMSHVCMCCVFVLYHSEQKKLM